MSGDYDHDEVLRQVAERRRRNAEAIADLPQESALDLVRRRNRERQARRAEDAGQLDLGGSD